MLQGRCEVDPARRIRELIDLAFERNRQQPIDRRDGGDERHNRQCVTRQHLHRVLTARIRLREKITVAASSTNDIAAA